MNISIPIDLIAYEVLRFVSYFELDNVLPYFNLTPKEHALIKFKIYKARLKKIVNKYGIEYRIENKLHCENGPAIIHKSGTIEYYACGLLHRLDGPAIIRDNGEQLWYKYNQLHNANGPAITHSDGQQEYYQNGKRHRLGGPAFIEPNGKKIWYKNGLCHRDDGPAIIKSSGRYTHTWYKNGRAHREDGPAIITTDGTELWFLHGLYVQYPEHNYTMTCLLDGLTVTIYVRPDRDGVISVFAYIIIPDALAIEYDTIADDAGILNIHADSIDVEFMHEPMQYGSLELSYLCKGDLKYSSLTLRVEQDSNFDALLAYYKKIEVY